MRRVIRTAFLSFVTVMAMTTTGVSPEASALENRGEAQQGTDSELQPGSSTGAGVQGGGGVRECEHDGGVVVGERGCWWWGDIAAVCGGGSGVLLPVGGYWSAGG